MTITEYLKKTVTPYHCVEVTAELLEQAGYVEQKLTDTIEAEPGGKYYLRVYGTGLMFYTVGESFRPEDGLRMAVAHTDYPCLRVKPKAELSAGGYKRLDVEVYGGPILNTWYDRPLSVAGKIVLRTEDPFAPKSVLLDAARPLLTIPNLAIHLNREVNKGVEYKPQRDLLPILGLVAEDGEQAPYFLRLLADTAGVSAEDILDFDISIYNCEEPCYLGEKSDLLSAPRLDNQVSCYAILEGMLRGGHSSGIHFAALLDHEEIGSRSKQGADSALTGLVLERIYASLGADRTEFLKALAGGLLLSVDAAHALHPNRPDGYDPVNRSLLNKGVVFKVNSSQRYAFDPEVFAILQMLCEKAGVPYQKFANHSDVVGGSTLGPILSSWIPMRAFDLGVPMLAMHSSRELCGAKDTEALAALLTAFYC